MAVSRLRRHIIRLIGWLIGVMASLAAVLLLVVAAYVLFFDYAEHIKHWMEAEASRILGRSVTIDEFEVNIPNSFELRGVSAASMEPGRPWLEFESLRGELKLAGVLQREVQLSLLQVDGLTLWVQDYGGGQVDLPGFSGPAVSRPYPASEVSFAFLADVIRLEDATFVYNNQNLPWRLEAADLAARLERAGRRGYRGYVRYDRGDLQIKDRPSFQGSLEAQLELVGEDLNIVDARATGPFYTVEAEGRVGLGADPQAQIAIELKTQVAPAAQSLLGLRQLDDAGPIQAKLTGELAMGRGWHRLRGQFDMPAARFAGIPLRNWKGAVYWDRSVLEVTSARGAFAGGVSDLQIRQALPLADHPTRLTIELQDASLQTLVRARTGEGGPLASDVSGKVRIDIPTDSPSEVTGEFELTGKSPETGELAGIDFSLRGQLDRGDLQIKPSRFVSGVAHAELSGSYPRFEPVDLRLNLDIRDLARADRIQQTLRNLFRPEYPAELLGLSGQGRAVGRLTGRFPRLAFEGDIRGTDVSFRNTALGDVDARGSWSTEAVRFESFQARKDDAMLRGTGELAMVPGAVAGWSIEGEAQEWPVQELCELLRVPIRLEGRLSASGMFSSHEGRRAGEGTARVTSGSLYGVRFDRAEIGVELNRQQIVLESLSVIRKGARFGGRLVFDTETGELGGQLASRRFPLSALAPETLELRGEAQARFELAGTWRRPKMVLEADIHSVALAGARMGDARLAARVDGSIATATVSLRGGSFEVDGNARTRLTPGYPIDGDLRWQGADMGPWMRSFRSGLPESLRFLSDGEASFRGQMSRLDSWSAEAAMNNISLEVGGYRLTSSRPLMARLRQGNIQLENLQLTGEGTEVTLEGRLPLDEGGLDLAAHGSVNLGILESFYPSLTSSGQVDLSARVRGTWERPSLSGYADFASGLLRVHGFPQALGNIHGRVSFDNRTVRFPNVQAVFGGAPVTVSGTLILRGFSPDSFELRFAGQELRVRYPEGLVATLDGDLRMTGRPQSQILSGRINVREATWSREYDLATGILVRQDAEAFDLLDEIDEEMPLGNLRFDVEIEIPGTLRVRNSRASIDAKAKLQLRGTFARPALLGRAESVRGELFFLGQRYDLVSGRVEFVDPSDVKPFFDLLAESRVRSYRVELRLAGTPERFFPELSSDPPLRTVDILRLLAGASERDILIGSEEEELAGIGVASLLTERLTQEVGRRAERLFGLDRFSIDPFLVGQFANPTARVSIGKQIYRDLSINYSTNLNSATETLVLIEYTPEGPVSWIISRDEEGAYGIDLRFRKSF